MMRWIILTLLLSACSQSYMVSDNLAYAYNLPPVGSKLVLMKRVSIEPGTTRTFLQRGKSMHLGDFDRYLANCNFEVATLSDEVQQIEPDSFVIKSVQRLTAQVVRNPYDQPRFIKAELDRGSPIVTHGYHLWLSSEKQPDVMRMTCRGAFDDLSRAQPPSINEIREALGEIAELVLAT
ncbi:MAG: hypothetical protein ABW098_02645 [Candidatus Thiodiazotropha sp.]